VVATVVRRGGRLLICRRPSHKRHGGLWEFPGGKLLPGETLGEAVSRELDEELGLVLRGLVTYLGAEQDPGSPFLIHFVEGDARGDPVPAEHDELAWARPEELRLYPLAPSDRAFAERLGQAAAPGPDAPP
jgi:mutator protein MutT